MTSNNEFDDLKRAMDAAMPAPDAERRAATLARAQEIFERTQGSRTETRPTPVTPESRGFLAGVFDMLLTKTTGALTATTALVAVGVLVLSPAGQDLLRGPQSAPPLIQEVAEEDAVLRDAPADAEIASAEPPTIEPVVIVPETRLTPQPGLFATADAPLSEAEAADGFASTNGIASRVAPRPLPGPAPSPAPAGSEAFGNLATAPTAIQPGNTLDLVPVPQPDTEEFANADTNPLRLVADDPVSTFSIDVDTAAYSLLRSTLNRGQLPPADAVRIEEMVNYFPYDYPAPDAGEVSPFRPTVNVFPTPWNTDTQLVHIGLQGVLPAVEDRPPLNLVFLIDTSGSMNDPAKLPLLIQSFRLMLDRLNPDDQVAIVTYAGNAGVVLEPTSAAETGVISRALGALQAGGSTNGVGGLQAAYDLAEEMTDDGEVSRVLLATDGDFNVGISDPDALERYIAEQRDTGIYLSVLGFGRGNLQDDTMQALAQNGNGTAAYIDTLHEAQRVLVDQLAGALFPIANDVKVQVEFNPDLIAEYRLIGYETRALAREDFANDAVDAGELGAGHSVTAIYEVTPVGSPAIRNGPLRYAAEEAEAPAIRAEYAEELGFLSLRWKDPGEDDSQLVEFPISASETAPGTEAQFAAAVAGFGELLRGSDFLGDWGYADAIALANANRGADEFGYRMEAVQLMRLAQSLSD